MITGLTCVVSKLLGVWLWLANEHWLQGRSKIKALTFIRTVREDHRWFLCLGSMWTLRTALPPELSSSSCVYPGQARCSVSCLKVEKKNHLGKRVSGKYLNSHPGGIPSVTKQGLNSIEGARWRGKEQRVQEGRTDLSPLANQQSVDPGPRSA